METGKEQPLIPENLETESHHHRASSCTERTTNEQQELIADFSGMFKRKGSFSKKPTRPKNMETKTPNWLLQIPAKLDITLDEIKERRVMQQGRWLSITKAKNTDSKLIAAVCSCWNYLAQTAGLGKQHCLTVSKCLSMISKEISAQSLQKTQQLRRITMIDSIIQSLNTQLPHKLSTKICVKLAKPYKLQTSAQQQKTSLLSGLQTSSKAYIYLAHNDIFCPIGFDITPLRQIQAYQKLDKINPIDQQLWIISSCLGRNEPSFSIKRWTDIHKDMETCWPDYFDIKEAKEGVRPHPDANETNREEDRGTSNCIIELWIQ